MTAGKKAVTRSYLLGTFKKFKLRLDIYCVHTSQQWSFFYNLDIIALCCSSSSEQRRHLHIQQSYLSSHGRSSGPLQSGSEIRKTKTCSHQWDQLPGCWKEFTSLILVDIWENTNSLNHQFFTAPGMYSQNVLDRI